MDPKGFAEQWANAWQQRDIERVLSHYADEVEFQSPLAARLRGDSSGTIRGKQDLREYLRKALSSFPGDIDMQVLGVFQGVNCMAVHFQVMGRRAVEVMELNAEGKVRRAVTLGQL